jgi:nitroimidazol reductase NimA-like FMN-containing flavoprotein (pyridoxamine 5'-phosphate oxidase superfamily)
MPNTAHPMVELDRATCLRLLSAAGVGRVVFTDAAMPAAAPVAYLVDGEEVVFRAACGSTLAGIGGSVVGFEADEIDVPERAGWSVLAVGHAYEVLDPERLLDLSGDLPATWSTSESEHVICISLQQLTGRLVRPMPARLHP